MCKVLKNYKNFGIGLPACKHMERKYKTGRNEKNGVRTVCYKIKLNAHNSIKK